MANHYHDKDDLKLLKEMSKLAPEEFQAWASLDGIVGREDGHIPRKYRELIALAVAHTTQCVYCIEVHAKQAKRSGCTKEEVAEAVLLAAALRAGGAAAHAQVFRPGVDRPFASSGGRLLGTVPIVTAP